jgi:hypothetical protein
LRERQKKKSGLSASACKNNRIMAGIYRAMSNDKERNYANGGGHCAFNAIRYS